MEQFDPVRKGFDSAAQWGFDNANDPAVDIAVDAAKKIADGVLDALGVESQSAEALDVTEKKDEI